MSNPIELSSNSLDITYDIKTSLPIIKKWNILNIFQSFEIKNNPRNIENLLEAWTQLLTARMHYDAMNYALMKEFPIDSEQWGWIDRLLISELSMNSEQVFLLIKTLSEYKKQYEKGSLEYTNIDLIILALRKWNFQQFITIFSEMPSLQKNILSDENFASKWMQLYEKKWIPELLWMWIWNCKVLAMMSKIILETWNSRWNLWIKKIDIIEWDDNHVTLKCYTKDWIIEYDPMRMFYKK